MHFKAAGLGLAAIIATLVPVQAVAAGDCPTDGACLVVTVKGPTPSVTALTYANLDDIADVHGADYRLRAPGEAPASHDSTVEEGVSLTSVLSLALDLDPSTVDRLNLDVPGQPSGTRTTSLSARQLGAKGSNGYADDLQPALTLDNGQLGYVRPLLEGSTSDVNTTVDSWSASGQVVRMTIWTSVEQISGHVVATRSSVRPQDPVTFSVAFDGHPDTSDLTYHWTFCDGSTTGTSLASPTRSWTKPSKSCAVSVVVSGLGFTSDITPATITVADAAVNPAPPTVRPTAAPTVTPTPDSGPANSGKSPTLELAHINENDLKILGGSVLPESVGAPVLTDPVLPGEVPPGAEGLTPVAGEFLESSTGELAPTGDDQVSPTLDDAARGARRSPFAPSSWLWFVVPLGLVVAGALVELRPRRKRI